MSGHYSSRGWVPGTPNEVLRSSPHSWARATIYFTPAPDQQCAYCGLAANTPRAAQIPCTPPEATDTDTAWALRDYVRRLEALGDHRPHPVTMLAPEIQAARKRLYQHLDSTGLAGSHYDDRSQS